MCPMSPSMSHVLTIITCVLLHPDLALFIVVTLFWYFCLCVCFVSCLWFRFLILVFYYFVVWFLISKMHLHSSLPTPCLQQYMFVRGNINKLCNVPNTVLFATLYACSRFSICPMIIPRIGDIFLYLSITPGEVCNQCYFTKQ